MTYVCVCTLFCSSMLQPTQWYEWLDSREASLGVFMNWTPGLHSDCWAHLAIFAPFDMFCPSWSWINILHSLFVMLHKFKWSDLVDYNYNALLNMWRSDHWVTLWQSLWSYSNPYDSLQRCESRLKPPSHGPCGCIWCPTPIWSDWIVIPSWPIYGY